MARRADEALRPLSAEEEQQLRRLARARSERGDVHQRAVALLAVAEGATRAAAAQRAGYTQGVAVSRVIHRFNTSGLAAVEVAPGRGRKPTYHAAERQQILDLLAESPERDQSATWSLTLLQRRRRGNGLPQISRDTLHQTLRAAGYRWQRTRTWCPTGTARRKRAAGVVTVVDPEAARNKG